MSNLTLEQVAIIDALTAAEKACEEAAAMIGYEVGTWSKGRQDGRTVMLVEITGDMIRRTLSNLKVSQAWQ